MPVSVRVIIESVLSDRNVVLPYEHYSGKQLWNLNPRFAFSAHRLVSSMYLKGISGMQTHECHFLEEAWLYQVESWIFSPYHLIHSIAKLIRKIHSSFMPA
jgi:hypothetical protein